MAFRYRSYDSRSSSTSSIHSHPSSSSEFKSTQQSSSRAIVSSKPSGLTKKVNPVKSKDPGNLTSMVKKLMEMKKSNPKKLVIPSDVIAEDMKRNAMGKGGGKNGFGALQRKLFGKTEKEKKQVKALTEVKGNTRTLAMVLRSESELLNVNKEQDLMIDELKLQLDNRNLEVEKLKDLCLKQRDEIKSLKNAILFPDVMKNQLQDILETQGSELQQARQIIPSLQKQVISLTSQLQFLAEDLAEVKLNKYSSGASYQRSNNSLEQTSSYDRGESSGSLDFSSDDPETLCDPDDLSLEDLNPCLTPYCRAKSKETKKIDDDDERGEERRVTYRDGHGLSSDKKKLAKRKPMSQRLF